MLTSLRASPEGRSAKESISQGETPRANESHPKGSLISSNSELLRQVCLGGAGLILMPTWLIGEDIQAGRLQAVLTDFQVHPQANMDMGIYALYLPNRRHSVRVKTFIDFLMKRLGAPPYWEVSQT